MLPKEKKYILWFDEIGKDDVALVGGKNANLGEMYQNLVNSHHDLFPNEQIKVPFGFAVTAYSYRYFLKENELDKKIHDVLNGLNTHHIHDLENAGKKIRELIMSASFPEDLEKEIVEAYKSLAKKLEIDVENLDVAVRSSATAEDLANASFAGQQESYLNVHGNHHLLESIKMAFASLFTNRAISYRQDQHFDHLKISLSCAVQKMVRSDKGSSGVMFTLDTESGFRNAILINGSWGLGDYIVKGIVTPDEYMVFKPTLKLDKYAIINKRLGTKEKKLVYSTEGSKPTKELTVHEHDRKKFVLTGEQILQLARWGMIIEDHYKKPMDTEWAYDGEDLYIVQARPETIHSRADINVMEEYKLKEHNGKILTEGAAVGSKIGHGKARFIKEPKQLDEFEDGEILIAEITDPDWEPIMKKASAIVTNSGGRTSHAAIVSRELGIPAVVGTGDATKAVPTGTEITVSCAEGESGKVYEGLLEFDIKKTNLKDFKPPKTKIKMIVADPEFVFKYSFIPNKGVGLAREEFIISNFIKVHPNALINYHDLEDKELKKQIDELTYGYEHKTDYYIDKLAYGISMIAAAFYPHEVILRFSDFKSNEYAGLLGGKLYEPEEENPMIGWRGASRYYDENFEKAFALECIAVKKVREDMGMLNLQVMIPFCRTPEEGKKVLEIMEKNGLHHHKISNAIEVARKEEIDERLRVWVMAEIPSNILQMEEFAKLFDGFSIGSNDLTQLTLGLDRDSKLVAHIANERSESVKKLISNLIVSAHKVGLPVGICGQGPSDFEDFAEFLVEEGIDSISLQPDTVLKTSIRLKALEDRLRK